MALSPQVKASIVTVAGHWAFERARMLLEESSRKPATKSFEDLLKEHFNDYYQYLLNKLSDGEGSKTKKDQ
jgi:hypothetical protein